MAKKRSIISDGASAVSTLMGIQDADGKPYFHLDFCIKQFLGLSDSDLELNRKFKEGDIVKQLEDTKLAKLREPLTGGDSEDKDGMDDMDGFNPHGFGGGPDDDDGEFGA